MIINNKSIITIVVQQCCGSGKVTNDIAWADVDFGHVDKIRGNMPVFQHKRYDIYKL